MDKLGAKALDVCIRHGLLEDVSLHYMLPEDRLNECHGLRILCRFGLPAVPGPCTCIHSASVWLDAGRPPYRLGLFDSMCPVRCESRAFRKRSSRTYVKRLGEASLQREDIPYMCTGAVGKPRPVGIPVHSSSRIIAREPPSR